jgi:hypothetical protein
MPPNKRDDFYSILNEAVANMAEHGYDDPARVAYWTKRLRDAIDTSFVPLYKLDEMLREVLTLTYKKMIEQGNIAQFHQGVERFTIDRIAPHLRAELDRRIMASASLIKLNREEMTEATLRRFQGWATSIPKGGSKATDKVDAKKGIKKAVKGLPFEERRVLIDQNAKLVSAINEIIATDGGAIAAIWRHTGRRAGYDPRPEHIAREGKIYAVKNNWAMKAGFMNKGPNGYTDSIEKPGELIYCSCHYEYQYSISDLPASMITAKGRDALKAVREQQNA